MAQLHVYDAFPRDDEHTVLVVRVVSGTVRLGDVVASVRRAAGPPQPMQLPVDALTGASGPVTELRSGAAGQVTVRGSARLQRGEVVETQAKVAVDVGGAAGAPPVTVPAGAVAEARPELAVAEPAHLNRWSTGLRWLLLVPQWVFGVVYAVVAEIVLAAGWLCALVLGRLPDGIRGFLAGYVAYTTRVNAYALLLTDHYPPFGPGPAADYPVVVAVPPATPLNRLAVLFRGLLVIPAALLAALLQVGWHVVSFVIWLIVLAGGGFPPALFDATAAIVRFQLRTAAYTLLLTPAYPRGVFGTTPAVAADGVVGRPLRGGAVTLLAVFIALGVLGYGGIAAGAVVGAHQPVTASSQAAQDLLAAHGRLASSAQTFQQEVAGCQQQPATRFTCVKGADGEFGQALSRFAAEMTRIDFPDAEQRAANDLAQTTQLFAETLRDLSTASDAPAYQRITQQRDPSRLGNRFDEQYAALIDNLSG